MARENRKFLGRAVRHLVNDAGIRQFLDIGTGIPTGGNVHEVAQDLAPDARVVYVDNDPIVLAHARALLVSGDRGQTTYIYADFNEPERILTDPALTRTLDLDQPVGLVMVAILMLQRDAEDPWAKSRALMDALPSGSYVAISHPGRDFDPETMAAIEAVAAQGHVPMVPRVREAVARFFADWELIDPGLVPVKAWRPPVEPVAHPEAAYYWAGVARKP